MEPILRNLLDKKVVVELVDGEVCGILYDYNKTHIQIEEEDDIREYRLNSVVDIREYAHAKLIKMLDEEGYEYIYDVWFFIHGDKYDVRVYVNDDGTYYCETFHKERFERLKRKRIEDPYIDPHEGATGNKRDFKTLKSVRKYIERYIYE